MFPSLDGLVPDYFVSSHSSPNASVSRSNTVAVTRLNTVALSFRIISPLACILAHRLNPFVASPTGPPDDRADTNTRRLLDPLCFGRQSSQVCGQFFFSTLCSAQRCSGLWSFRTMLTFSLDAPAILPLLYHWTAGSYNCMNTFIVAIKRPSRYCRFNIPCDATARERHLHHTDPAAIEGIIGIISTFFFTVVVTSTATFFFVTARFVGFVAPFPPVQGLVVLLSSSHIFLTPVPTFASLRPAAVSQTTSAAVFPLGSRIAGSGPLTWTSQRRYVMRMCEKTWTYSPWYVGPTSSLISSSAPFSRYFAAFARANSTASACGTSDSSR